MKENFDIAFELTIVLEGKPSNDPNDPGGFTIWGLAKKYHPWINMQTTKDQAKKVYYEQYWKPSGCDEAPFPMDICLFDSAVNPQNDPKLPYAGNKELLLLEPENWQDYQLLRIERYMRRSTTEYVKGHIFRVLKLNGQIRQLIKRKKTGTL
jgi:hypothetical protein